MPAITNDWAEYLKPEYKKPYYKKLFDFVGQAYATETVYPPADDIFNAFHTTPLSHVRSPITDILRSGPTRESSCSMPC